MLSAPIPPPLVGTILVTVVDFGERIVAAVHERQQSLGLDHLPRDLRKFSTCGARLTAQTTRGDEATGNSMVTASARIGRGPYQTIPLGRHNPHRAKGGANTTSV